MEGVNLKAQTNALQTFLTTFWDEDWIAGGFVWKWHYNQELAGGHDNSRFTPQNKPAEKIINDFYLKH